MSRLNFWRRDFISLCLDLLILDKCDLVCLYFLILNFGMRVLFECDFSIYVQLFKDLFVKSVTIAFNQVTPNLWIILMFLIWIYLHNIIFSNL